MTFQFDYFCLFYSISSHFSLIKILRLFTNSFIVKSNSLCPPSFTTNTVSSAYCTVLLVKFVLVSKSATKIKNNTRPRITYPWANPIKLVSQLDSNVWLWSFTCSFWYLSAKYDLSILLAKTANFLIMRNRSNKIWPFHYSVFCLFSLQ